MHEEGRCSRYGGSTSKLPISTNRSRSHLFTCWLTWINSTVSVLSTTTDAEEDHCTKLTSQSTFISLFCAALSKTNAKLSFLSLTISLDHSAIRPLIITLGTLSNAQAVVIRHDAVMDHSRRLLHPQDRFILLPNAPHPFFPVY